MRIRTVVRRWVRSAGVLPAAFVIYRFARDIVDGAFVRNRRLRNEWSSSIPLPPDRLLYFATTTRNLDWYLTSGSQTAAAISEVLQDVGRPIETLRRVLDFGCGCGRVLRQWHAIVGPEFHGSDYNVESTEWVAANLPHVKAAHNQLEPPLLFDSGYFDLIYAISVFTHWPKNLQFAWLRELHRVLAPGGLLLLTLDSDNLRRLRGGELEQLERGELVVTDATLAGTNMCAAYHPAAWVRRHFADGSLFRELRYLPGGGRGAAQDLWLLERVP
jgi:SAM-dependent methyltransferase